MKGLIVSMLMWIPDWRRADRVAAVLRRWRWFREG